MYILKYSGKIKKDIKLRQKRGYHFQLFEFVLEKLMKPEPLDIKNKDHDLRGGIQRIQRMSYLTGLVINLSL